MCESLLRDCPSVEGCYLCFATGPGSAVAAAVGIVIVECDDLVAVARDDSAIASDDSAIASDDAPVAGVVGFFPAGLAF